MAKYNPALQAIPALGQVGVLALGGWMALRGSITLGTFLAFSSYLIALVGPVRSLAALVTLGQEARASVIRVFEVIDARPVVTDRPGALALPPQTPGVEFDDVFFGYVPSQPVLRGLSLRVAPGETLALVGTAGSGKSTISLLLPRFYDVRGGQVSVGGFDVRDLTRDSLRAAIGLVLEESFLFSDTVAANIAFGRPDATREQVMAAARAAEAHEFITGLPQGYDTVVGEQGLTLSGGQRQRVALARALITDPRILVLDDATSAVDPRGRGEVHQTLRRVMEGRTTLLIAHRRSTLRLADRIAVLDEGRLVAAGSHEELMASCPLYRLLLAGPGDDAEGIGAGELGFYSGDTDEAEPGAAGPAPAAVTATGAGTGEPVALAARPGAPARSTSGKLRTGASCFPRRKRKDTCLPPRAAGPRWTRAAARVREELVWTPPRPCPRPALLRCGQAAAAVPRGVRRGGWRSPTASTRWLAWPASPGPRASIDQGIEAQMLSAIFAVSAVRAADHPGRAG